MSRRVWLHLEEPDANQSWIYLHTFTGTLTVHIKPYFPTFIDSTRITTCDDVGSWFGRCHLPVLYVGLEYGLTNNTKLAERFFTQAFSIAPQDPFVLHEMGTVAFQNHE